MAAINFGNPNQADIKEIDQAAYAALCALQSIAAIGRRVHQDLPNFNEDNDPLVQRDLPHLVSGMVLLAAGAEASAMTAGEFCGAQTLKKWPK